MTVHGHIQNGHVVLDGPLMLPDGTRVTVSVEPVSEVLPKEGESYPSLYERMKPIIGKAKGLPPDLAINHDHYLHGQPKRR